MSNDQKRLVEAAKNPSLTFDYELAQEMEAYYTELAEQVIPSQGMFNDLFNSALREVCWYDIASHYLETAEV